MGPSPDLNLRLIDAAAQRTVVRQPSTLTKASRDLVSISVAFDVRLPAPKRGTWYYCPNALYRG